MGALFGVAGIGCLEERTFDSVAESPDTSDPASILDFAHGIADAWCSRSVFCGVSPMGPYDDYDECFSWVYEEFTGECVEYDSEPGQCWIQYIEGLSCEEWAVADDDPPPECMEDYDEICSNW
jgi:hypothetical protein